MISTSESSSSSEITSGVEVNVLALVPEDMTLQEQFAGAVFERETVADEELVGDESFFPFEPVLGIGLNISRARRRLSSSLLA